MKKIIAILLSLFILTALSSCGINIPSAKSFKNEVKTEDFYKSLKDKLGLDRDGLFDQSMNIAIKESESYISKTTYSNGKKTESKEYSHGVQTLRYDEKIGVLNIKQESSGTKNSSVEKTSFEHKSEICYYQDKNDMLRFDGNSMTYTRNKNNQNGVQSTVNSGVLGHIKIIMDEAILYGFLFSENDDDMFGYLPDINDVLEFDEDADVEYYIDGNTYTVVRTKYDDSDIDDDSSYKSTSVKELILQIVVTDSKITIIREETERSEYSCDSYKIENAENISRSLELERTDLKLNVPDIDKYTEIKND